MELMLKRASKILQWVGWVSLGALGMTMLIFGFIGSMVAIAVLAVENGGDPSPIFFIIKGTNFLFQFACVMFTFAILTWIFSEISKSNRLRRERWYQSRREAIVEIKEAVLDDLKTKKRRRN